MIKIPTLFKRNLIDFRVIPELTEGCEWVLEGKGFTTIMIDGMNVMVKQGVLHKRQKPADGEYTEASYVPCVQGDPADQYLFDAWNNSDNQGDGIYEAYGPKIKGNPQRADKHRVIKIAPVSGTLIVPPMMAALSRGYSATVEELYDSIKRQLRESPEIEGLVFQLEEPAMHLKAAAKIKRKDFGFPWPDPSLDTVVTDIVTGA